MNKLVIVKPVFHKYSGLLPDSLTRQIKNFRSRLWRVRIAEALFLALSNLGLGYAVLYLSDRLWDTPHGMIWAVFILSFAGILVFSPFWLVKWVVLKRTPLQVAGLLEKVMPALGDKLRGIIELADDRSGDRMTSQSLRQAAIAQVSSEVSQINLPAYIPAPRHKKYFRYFLLIALLIGAAGFFTPEAAQNAFARWSNPSNPPERFTFTQFEPRSREIIVPMGELVSIDFPLSENSPRIPERASYRFNDGKWIETDLKRDPACFTVDIPSFQKEVELRLQAGDADLSFNIIPRPRPALQRAVAEVTPPEYLGRGAQEVPVRAGVVSILKGSQARVKAVATQELQSVRLAGHDAGAVEINGSQVLFPALEIDDQRHELNFSWTDRDSLDSHTEMTIKIEPLVDQAASVRMQAKGEERYILTNMSLEIDLDAADDYGLMELGIEWITDLDPVGEQEGAALAPGEIKGVAHELILKQGKRDETFLKAPFVFQADELGIMPQRVIVRAFTRDYFPGRARSYSEPVVLYVLTPEQHLEMIKQAIERLVSSLEDVIRDMDDMTDVAEDMLKKDPGELASQEERDQAKNLSAQEELNIDRINELKERGEQIFQEAARNTHIEPDAMKNLMEALEAMKGTAENKMSEAQEGFNESSKQNQEQKENLEQATQDHKDATNELRKTSEKLTQSTQQLEASTYTARLRFAARQVDIVINALIGNIQDLVGLKPTQLSSRQTKEMNNLATLQVSTTKVVHWILQELDQYRNRQNIEPVYGKIYQEMFDADIVGKLEKVTENINSTRSGIGIEEAGACSELLKKWADVLDDQQQKGGGGGGEGGGDDESLSDEDFEFLLKIMRMIQQQQDIRTRTRTLEQSKETIIPASAT